jgi:hypothetical protein
VKLPWAEVMMGCDGKLNVVHYKICNEIDGKEKLLYRSTQGGKN